MAKLELKNKDCFNCFQYIPNGSVDLIFTDLPYGVTKNKWDSELNLGQLWVEYERMIKPNGAIILFAQDKFSAKLMLSNEKLHRYNIIWEKTTPTGHERKVSTAQHKRNSKKTTNYGKHGLTTYDSTERYPKSVWKFATDKQKEAIHPTQKPIALCEEIVKTYTNVGDCVLDNCMGSGTIPIACLNTKRICIGFEKEKDIYQKAIERIKSKFSDLMFSEGEDFLNCFLPITENEAGT